MPCPSTDHLVEILNELYNDKKKLEATAELCYTRALDEQFSWTTIAMQFSGLFQDTLDEISHDSKKEKANKKKIRKKRKIRNA